MPLLGQDADDVEWYFTPDDLIVQFRAERRSGRADFGTNRQRLEDDGRGGSWRISKQQSLERYGNFMDFR